MVLGAEIVELPRGARLNARSADISRTGVYIDTLNPTPSGSRVRVRLTHGTEVFDVTAKVVYVSPGLGMGVQFEDPIPPEQLAILDRWLNEPPSV
jgi:hypothetical protein